MNDPKELELFNLHQEEARKRTEFLAKSVFLISGTGLTLSINLFLGDGAPTVAAESVTLLRVAWWALFASIVGYVLVLSIMLIRDYQFGERWRSKIHGENVDTRNTPGWLDGSMWALGTLSMLCFLFGIGGLAWVSSALLGSLP
ncbi:MAG: hypothetical protein HZA59_12305 [Hydrogenophilales bacterium]|nr:hypothetical protein [Hydrogenophilales bacterium]